MILHVANLVGIEGLPSSPFGIRKWLVRKAVPITGEGKRFTFHLSDLPAPVRRAVLEREAERAGLEPGVYDEEAHEELMGATPGMRAKAERLAEIARFVLARRNAGLSRAEVFAAARAQFGADCTSDASLDRLSRRVDGVDPVNFAPALLDGYSRAGAPKTTISHEAWAVFEGGLKAAFKTHRIIALYNDVAALAKVNGWAWPSYPTIQRRLKALPLAERIALREGRDAAHKALYQAQLRDSSGLRAMEWVVLDGRTVDVWVTWEDGAVIRPTVIGLVDQASGKVLDIEIARSENAQALATLERRTFTRFGAPENLLTDNGAAFSGHIHAGRVAHKHRNKGNRRREFEPPGIHMLLGFNLHFALPKNAQAKLMERKFADMSREIDTAPEFMGAHSGSHPGERPEGTIVPVPLDRFKAVYMARLAAYNARTGRRSQACIATNTGSYDAAFAALGAGRVPNHISEAQFRLATMEWTLATVLPDGRMRGKDGWIYGEDMDDGSQDRLLRFQGRKVWLGTDPLDRSKPALVWNPETDRIIMDGVHAVVRGAFDDAEGARRSGRRKSELRKQTKRWEKIDEQAAIAALAVILGDVSDEPAPPPAKVVKAHFKSPVRPARADASSDPTPAQMAEFRRNFDDHLRRNAGAGEKLA